ncbi:MAG: response regulator [Rhizonema sp. NSF051]|nr:response regulator [Rhizonema sp. NSF051]
MSSVDSRLFFPSEFQPEQLLMLPSFAYYIRKLLRQSAHQLQTALDRTGNVPSNPIRDLDTTLEQLYPQVTICNMAVIHLEKLVLSHQNVRAKNQGQSPVLKTIEQEIFTWLGYHFKPVTPQSVLIIDDVLENIALLSNILQSTGYQVHSAMSGQLALNLVQEIQPDLILLDILLPDINGYQVCQELKKMPQIQAIPVIFLSALDSLDDRAKATELGGVNYITKPFTVNAILEKVTQHLPYPQPQAFMFSQRLEQLPTHSLNEQPNANVFDSADAAFQVTIDGRYLRINQQLARLFGYSSSQEMLTAIPNIWQHLYVDSQHQEVWQVCRQHVNQMISIPAKVYCQDSQILSIVEQVRAVQDSFGNLLFYEGIVQPQFKVQ